MIEWEKISRYPLTDEIIVFCSCRILAENSGALKEMNNWVSSANRWWLIRLISIMPCYQMYMVSVKPCYQIYMVSMIPCYQMYMVSVILYQVLFVFQNLLPNSNSKIWFYQQWLQNLSTPWELYIQVNIVCTQHKITISIKQGRVAANRIM